jgi:AraC family transcriptional regulator
MSATTARAERQYRIHQVIDYITTHLDQEITMQTLGNVAHYSPFHLQKLFKQLVGESPKQYALKLRLETAFHLLIIHPQKSIQEIAIDSGFSSPAVFSRAIRNYFGYPPEQLRRQPHRIQMKSLHGQQYPQYEQFAVTPAITNLAADQPFIRVIRKEPVNGIYQLTTFNQPAQIQHAFKSLTRFANTRGLPFKSLTGILAPLQRNTYKAFLPLREVPPQGSPFPTGEIKGGAFATFTVCGDLQQTKRAAHHFLHRWLPTNGYKIAGVAGFETFMENPAVVPYFQLQRQIHIPIEPAS